MPARKSRLALPPPYLLKVWLDKAAVPDPAAYPFCLPALRDLDLSFERPITIIVGENGVGKSTMIEGIAALAGYDDAGGGKGYRPVDHADAVEKSGGELATALKAAWRPRITDGWFFKAETFFSVARYLDAAGSTSADFLSHSHGEGFLRFFEERTSRQGIYFFDEPESALSPARQLHFLKVLQRMEHNRNAQVIMATHAPMLMAYPGAGLLRLSKGGFEPVTVEETEHFRMLREFCDDPHGYITEGLAGLD